MINFISTGLYRSVHIHKIFAVYTQNKDFLTLHEQVSLIAYNFYWLELFSVHAKVVKSVHSFYGTHTFTQYIFNTFLWQLNFFWKTAGFHSVGHNTGTKKIPFSCICNSKQNFTIFAVVTLSGQGTFQSKFQSNPPSSSYVLRIFLLNLLPFSHISQKLRCTLGNFL